MNKKSVLSDMKKVLLIGFNICPYVHRVRFLLEETGCPYEMRIVDPYIDKPDWFVGVSPTGKVPVIKIGNKTLFESNVIMEFFNDMSGGELMPGDNWRKAQHRLLVIKAEKFMACLWNLYTADDKSKFDDGIHSLRDLYCQLDQELGGSYKDLIENPNVLSCTYAPIFYKTILIGKYCNRNLFPDCSGLLEWRNSMMSRLSFKQTIPEGYDEDTQKFICKQKSILATIIKNSDVSELA